jgi:hypothetical protein
MMSLPEFVCSVDDGEFRGLITEKRDGYHIVCNRGSDGCVVYRTKNDNSLIGDGTSPVRKTLEAIEQYLRDDGDRFNPLFVWTAEDGRGDKLHLEFCVRLKGDIRDDLQALMHGKWVANPLLYDVHVAVFDVEYERGDECDGPRYSSRHYALSQAFPDHIVRALRTTEHVIEALSVSEGIVAYNRMDYPKKVKAQHPIPMKIVGMRRSVINDPGYDQFLLAVASGPTTYTVMHELDYSNVLCEPDEKGRAFVRPESLMYEADTKMMTTWSKSVVAPFICAVNTAVLQSPRIDAIRITKTSAHLSNNLNINIPGSRHFKIDKDYVFIRPVSIVVSPNAVWRIQGDAIHMQALSVLAVGEHIGSDMNRRLLKRASDIKDVNAIVDGDMCLHPKVLHTYMHGKSVDPFDDLRAAFAAQGKK